jgi:Phage terminase large subunit
MSIISNSALVKAKIKRSKAASQTFDVSSYLFPEQLKFIRDSAPNKLAVCSRRSGKTIACAADLIETAMSTPSVVCLYITLSRNNAKKIIWREIKKINRDYKLGGVENLSELSMTFPNHSIIYLSGAKDTNEIEKFRGLALKLVYIDEAQSFREYIQELINDVLSPALMDYAGTLVLIGTPGAIPTGYFHDCALETSNWSKHSWTFWNNPFILAKSKMTHKQMLDRELNRRGVLATDPSIQREWYGRWVLDSDSLLVHYDQNKNHYTELPNIMPNKYTYIMGIDLGFDDADAIAVLAYEENSPNTYLVEEKVVPQQGLTELVEQIQVLRKKYDVCKIVIDQGGLGKKLAEEMRRRHQIPVEPADKARKMEHIAFLNDHLRTGKFKAKSASKFAQDSYLVEIDRDKSTSDKIKVSDKYHSDILDAALYAFVASPAFAYQAPIKGPEYGSKEWALLQETDMFDKEVEKLQKEQELTKDPFSYESY